MCSHAIYFSYSFLETVTVLSVQGLTELSIYIYAGTPTVNFAVIIDGKIAPGLPVTATVTGSVAPAAIATLMSIKTLNYEVIFNGLQLFSGSTDVASLVAKAPTTIPSSIPFIDLPILPSYDTSYYVGAILALADGQPHTFTRTFTVPSIVPTGSYYAGVSAVDGLGAEVLCYEVYANVDSASRMLR